MARLKQVVTLVKLWPGGYSVHWSGEKIGWVRKDAERSHWEAIGRQHQSLHRYCRNRREAIGIVVGFAKGTSLERAAG